MVLKQVLKQAGGYRHPEVLIGMGTAFACETPHFVGVLLDMVGNIYDRLPARVQPVSRRFLTRENLLGFLQGVGECLGISQRPR